MKKTIFGIILTLGFIGFGQAAVLDDAVSWMHSNGLTIFKTTKDYKPNNPIRRDEAAKLFVKFAKLKDKDVYMKTAKECRFSDLNDAHADLKDIIVESCRMGIFQGSAGRFMPRGQLTNEQAVTVLVRILVGNQSETGVSSRSENYYKKANEMGLLKNVNVTNRTTSATRGTVARLIYNPFKHTTTTTTKKYTGQGISFDYPSDGIITTFANDHISISNFSPSHGGFELLNIGNFMIQIQTFPASMYTSCLPMLGLNKNGEPMQYEKSDVLNSTEIINGVKIYKSTPEGNAQLNGQGRICIERPNSGIQSITYGIRGSEINIESIIINSLEIE